MREVFADFTELFFDDVEVVEEPLGGGRDGAVLADRVGQRAIDFDEAAAVLLDARQKPLPPPRPRRDAVLGGQRLGVLFEAFEAKQLASNRLQPLAHTARLSLPPKKTFEKVRHGRPNLRNWWRLTV